ncbi:MAG: acetolactate synthase-1/2/3 large subunit, partial [Myxococcota bacterium]
MSTVADHVAQALYARGTRHAWGMPGGDSLHLVRAFAEAGIAFHLVRDEASAGFAADASAQLSGAPGACLATLGPGLTNMVSGVVGCWLDRAPVLALTSRYRTDRRGVYTHMMFDQSRLLDATAKATWRLTADGAAGEVRRALAVAHAPRPGPVWLEIPNEVAGAPHTSDPLPLPPAPAPATPHAALVQRVAQWTRPVVLVGFAARHTDVPALAERLRAPVITTYKAKGALPEGEGWAAGAAGLSPVADAVHRQLVDRADGLLLLGWDPAELRDHWLPGWGPAPEVVVLDTASPTDLPTRLDAVHVGDLAGAVDALVGSASSWTEDDVRAHRAAHDAVFHETVFGPATA